MSPISFRERLHTLSGKLLECYQTSFFILTRCALAARVDFAKEYIDGSMGQNFKLEVQKKIDLLLQRT
jgi:hypothetical protein